jgi:hypothetical protein
LDDTPATSSKPDFVRRAGVAVVSAVIFLWGGLEVLEQFQRVEPFTQFAKPPLELREDTVALAKVKRFRPFCGALKGNHSVGFISDPATEWVADRMLIQSLVAPTLVLDPKLPGEPPLYIAFFADDASLDAFLVNRSDLVARCRLGDGLALLERRRP